MRSHNVFSLLSIDTQMIDLGTDKFSPFERASVADTTCGCCVCVTLVLDKGLPLSVRASPMLISPSAFAIVSLLWL